MSTRLTAGDAELTMTPRNGCRIASLRVAGTELLRAGDRYGCFPMVPFCGRLELGEFRNGGVKHRLPADAPPHAIHGTGRTTAWRTVRADDAAATFSYDLADPWPYPGRVTQVVELEPDKVTLTLAVETAGASFPAQAGWHPWFLRHLGANGGGDTADRPAGDTADDTGVRIDFAAAWQEQRGADHLPTGRRVEPLPGPWDDCFGMPDGVEVTLTWPGALELTVTSRAEWVVVFDQQPEAVCVEPQTGPPNGLNTHPRLVTPIEPLEVSTTWAWRTLG